MGKQTGKQDIARSRALFLGVLYQVKEYNTLYGSLSNILWPVSAPK
jgi:hypothetical protein